MRVDRRSSPLKTPLPSDLVRQFEVKERKTGRGEGAPPPCGEGLGRGLASFVIYRSLIAQRGLIQGS